MDSPCPARRRRLARGRTAAGARPVAGHSPARAALPMDRGPAPGRPMRPDFSVALRDGVADRPVFRWQYGAIQRGSLVLKPIRVVAGEEAQTLGGRGTFELGGVRPPRARAAWTEVDVTPGSAGPDDVLVLEVGGEINTIRQVLASLFVVAGAGAPDELRLVRPAFRPGTGVSVVQARYGLPVTRPDAAGLFRGVDAEFRACAAEIQRELARSPVPLIRQLAEHVALAGGKRLRPILVLLSARLAGGPPGRAARLGCVVELLHTATLIHDDVVDQAPLRRGQPSANARWGPDASVLVGDHLYSRC